MSDIYALTSSHIYGLTYRIVDNEADAAKVMKAVYQRLWMQRFTLSDKTLEPLDWLRATAHRYAIDCKTTQTIISDTPSVSRANKHLENNSLETLDLSEDEKFLLKNAYMNPAALSQLSDKNNQTEDDIIQRLERINRKIQRVSL